ncbi:hypothetical protein ACDX78_03790 [Virgibacillus oceani]
MQILDLLTEMNAEMKSMKTDVQSLNTEMKSMKSEVHSLNSEMKTMKSEMHDRFDTIEAKLEGVPNQLELTTEARINEGDFIVDKVNKMEKEIYVLKNKMSKNT